ncbi:MAG: TonB-dependent receptor plug domain-containing protein [Succiniclasticum sp.]|jgi:vitamin B12 transporter
MQQSKLLTLSVLMTFLITGAASAATSEEGTLNYFTLDQVVVTATRDERRDVDVPASTEVLNREDIRKTGGTNLAMVLQKLPGVTYKSFGPTGASMGTMINEAIIRGVDNGTLVLVNGNPINWRGKYNLESISADDIERIEMVKGGGSVLYGSEGMGGVINVITKKKADSYVKAGIGNYGRKTYGFDVGNDKFQVSYDREKWDKKIDKISESELASGNRKYGETKTSVNHVRRQNVGLNYNINDRLSVNYHYFETKANYMRDVTQSNARTMKVGTTFNNRLYTTEQHMAELLYNDDKYKGSLYFVTGTVESEGNTHYSKTGKVYKPGTSSYFYNTREKNRTIGADIQRKWIIGDKAKAILGFDYKRENYQKLFTHSTSTHDSFSRNMFGVFGQWDQKFDEKNSFVLSCRETWTTDAFNGQNYSNFSAAGQFVHKLDEDDTLYASVAQSFIMPSFGEMFPTGYQSMSNPALKPQKGMNYEIGWKRIAGAHNWKVALYNIRIKDNITATWQRNTDAWQYNNEDFKNFGFEIGDTIRSKGAWSYNWAVNLQNPKSKSEKKGYWDNKYGKYQIAGGVGYTMGKFDANFSGSFLGDRVQTPSAEHSFDTRPYFLTTLTAHYSPDKNNEISLVVDNLLDRNDVVSHSSSTYYATPCNFLLQYKYKF